MWKALGFLTHLFTRSLYPRSKWEDMSLFPQNKRDTRGEVYARVPQSAERLTQIWLHLCVGILKGTETPFYSGHSYRFMMDSAILFIWAKIKYFVQIYICQIFGKSVSLTKLNCYTSFTSWLFSLILKHICTHMCQAQIVSYIWGEQEGRETPFVVFLYTSLLSA